MTSIQKAKETICSSLLYRVSAYEKMMSDTEDINKLKDLHKTKNQILFRLEMLCR